MTIDRDTEYRETLDRAFRELAAERLDFELPDPEHVYWRSRVLERLARRTEAAERAARPVQWVQALAGTAVMALLAAAAALLLTALLGEGAEVLQGLAPGVEPGVVQLAVVAGLSLLAAGAVVGLQLASGEG